MLDNDDDGNGRRWQRRRMKRHGRHGLRTAQSTAVRKIQRTIGGADNVVRQNWQKHRKPDQQMTGRCSRDALELENICKEYMAGKIPVPGSEKHQLLHGRRRVRYDHEFLPAPETTLMNIVGCL